jgi:hypothetical protein
VLVVVDRRLWRVGRTAHDAIVDDMAPLDALRAYLRAADVAVTRTSDAWARDISVVPAVRRLVDGHNQYLFDVTRSLLDAAVERGDIADVDTAAVARVMAGLARAFAPPEVAATLRTPPKEAADAVVDLILKGLTR